MKQAAETSSQGYGGPIAGGMYGYRPFRRAQTIPEKQGAGDRASNPCGCQAPTVSPASFLRVQNWRFSPTWRGSFLDTIEAEVMVGATFHTNKSKKSSPSPHMKADESSSINEIKPIRIIRLAASDNVHSGAA